MEDKYYVENIKAEVEQLKSEDIKIPTISQISIIFSISLILFLFIGGRLQRHEFYSGVLATEILLVMLPALALLFIYRYNVKKVLRLNKVSFLNLFLIFWIMIFAIPVVGIFNAANLWIIKQIFGRVAIAQPPIASGSMGLLLSILVIAGSAGICEEILFRGVIQRGFEKFGVTKAILLASFLFGLMHIDFQKLLGTFLLGALIGFIVYRSDSIFSGMFAHFTNNSIAVILAFISTKILEKAKSSGIGGLDKPKVSDFDFSAFTNMPKAQLIIVIAVYSIIILFCIAAFGALLVAFIKNTSKKQAQRVQKVNIKGMVWLIPGLSFIMILYFNEALALKGINNEAINNIIRFIGLK